MSRPFVEELDQLVLQVELLAARVESMLDDMRRVLFEGDTGAVARARAADQAVVDSVVSLVERCHELLIREAPMASDNRLVMAIIRILHELERIGDQALRVVSLLPDQPHMVSHPASFATLAAMHDAATAQFRAALRAWSSRDLALATAVTDAPPRMESYYERLMAQILRLDGPDAVPVAVASVLAGRSLERICEHAGVIAARVRYLITADPRFLAAEISPAGGVDR